MSARLEFKGKEIATGWPATVLIIAFFYVMFCVLFAVGAAGTYLALSAVWWLFA